MLSLVLNEGVHKRGLSINLFVKMMCENPARIWGIYPKKGAIRIGSDADLTIIDLNAEQTIKSENLYSQAGWSTYEGWKVKGIPTATFVRGNLVAENGVVVGDRGFGEFVSYSR
jgi:dihydroorotase-like cyclic amidohydrolase